MKSIGRIKEIGAFLGFLGILCAGQISVAGQDPAPSPTPSPAAKPPAENLLLDRNEIKLPCPRGTVSLPTDGCDDPTLISVSAPGTAAEAGAEYHYTISGGKILGTGPSVTWDLTGVQPGTYTIGLTIQTSPNQESQTMRGVVKVAACKCASDCVCPALSVDAAKLTVTQGEKAAFTARVQGGSLDAVGYRWIVKNGRVVSGQDTPSIEVLPDESAREVTATLSVKWGGDNESHCGGICLPTATETVRIKQVIMGRVTSVTEGDIIGITDSLNKRMIVRLAGIDAPELKQPFGEQSRQSLSALILGKVIRVEVEKTGAGRLYGRVFLEDRDINLAQLKAGYAWHKKSPPDLAAEDERLYADAEDAARSAGTNLWSEKNPTPPWEFRERAPKQ